MSAKQSTKACLVLISQVGKQGAAFEALVIKATKAVIEHARLYHDVTLAMRLINTVAENCKGYVANELAQYIKRHTPIKLEYSDDKRTIMNATEAKDKDGNLAKAYSPDDVLDKAPFHLENSVGKRTQQEIKPFSIVLVKDRIASLLNQLKLAQEPGGRGVIGNPATIEMVIKAALGAVESVVPMPNKTEEKEDTEQKQDHTLLRNGKKVSKAA